MEHFDLAAHAASRVKEQIKAQGTSVSWLCDRTGIPRTTMHRRLTGHSAFNLNELAAIAEALHIAPADLLDSRKSAA